MAYENISSGSNEGFSAELPASSNQQTTQEKKGYSAGKIIGIIALIIVGIIVVPPLLLLLFCFLSLALGSFRLIGPLVGSIALVVVLGLGIFVYNSSIKSKKHFSKFLPAIVFGMVFLVLLVAGDLHDTKGLTCSIQQGNTMLVRPILSALTALCASLFVSWHGK